MVDIIEQIEKKVDDNFRTKKLLKNVAWYNFGSYFLYGYAVAMAVYTPRWDVGLMIACVGTAFGILSWKNMREVGLLLK